MPTARIRRDCARANLRIARRYADALTAAADAYHAREIDHVELRERTAHAWRLAEAARVEGLVSAMLRAARPFTASL